MTAERQALGRSLPIVRRWGAMKARQREEIIAYTLISPWVVGFLIFTLGAMIASLVLSFTETDMLTLRWVGLDNYQLLLSTDKTLSLFWTALYNTGYYVVLSIPFVMVTGFLVAVLLNQNVRGQVTYRNIYYLPSVLPGIAVSLLWLWLFNRDFGILNYLLGLVGIRGPSWLFDPRWAKPALLLMSVWGAGGNMLIFLGGLQAIPTQLYEAATIDGAGAMRRFFSVTIPMMSPTLFFVLVTDIIASFQVFTNAYIMTAGGPNNSTLMYVLYLYNLAFKQFRFGLASALAWVFFIIMMIFTVVLFRSSSAWVYYEGEIGGRRS
ncbi:MAG: carbohydrate ABC transporter permease [Anaerolineae bacterium]